MYFNFSVIQSYFILFTINLDITWILQESEAFIGKASKGEDVVYYFEPLVTQHMEASGSPFGWNMMRKKDDHPINLLGCHAQMENLNKSLFDKGL